MSTRKKTLTAHALLLCLIATFVVGIAVGRVHAQGGNQQVSCADRYGQFTSASWNALEQCIQDTNDMSYGWRRLAIRVGCNGRWLSNAWQAEGDYLSCMSLGKLAGIR